MTTRETVNVTGTKTVDQLPEGSRLSELDAFIAMQGPSTARVTHKITGMQLKEFIAGVSVTKIEAGQNITVSPPSSDGVVTVSMTAAFPFFEQSGEKKVIPLTN
jgi:hypothetical protein